MKTTASVCLVLVVALATSGRADPKPDRRAVGRLTFALPAGWTFSLDPGVDHARITNVTGQRYCMISVYEPRAAGGDLEAEFAVEWKGLSKPSTETVAPPLPATRRRKIDARTVVEASATVPVEGKPLLEQLAMLSTGGQVATLVIWTPDARATAAYQADLDRLLASIEVAPSPVAAARPVAPSAAGVALASVTLPDLVGTWDETGGSSKDWIDSSTGQYKTSTVAFYGASHQIAPDGTFQYLFVGRADSHTVKEGDRGTIGFTKDGFLVIKYKERKVDAVRELRIIGFVTVPDGTSLMSLVNAHPTQKEVQWTDPHYLANFCGGSIAGAYTSCVGGETWRRSPARAK